MNVLLQAAHYKKLVLKIFWSMGHCHWNGVKGWIRQPCYYLHNAPERHRLLETFLEAGKDGAGTSTGYASFMASLPSSTEASAGWSIMTV